jgi:hypothetical protein
LRQFEGTRDVAIPVAFVAAAEQDDNRVAAPDEIHPVARTVIGPHLRHAAAHRLHVAIRHVVSYKRRFVSYKRQYVKISAVLAIAGQCDDKNEWSDERRWAILDDLVAVPAEFNLPICIVVVERSKFQRILVSIARPGGVARPGATTSGRIGPAPFMPASNDPEIRQKPQTRRDKVRFRQIPAIL